MAEQDDKQRELDRLIAQMREGSNADALKAVDELRERGWLYDRSLRDADLQRVDLQGADLERIDIRGAKLDYATLTGCNLSHANLGLVHFLQTELSHANLSESECGHAYLSSTNLENTILERANLHAVNFGAANLSNASLTGANLNAAYLLRTNLNKANFTEAVCLDTKFIEVDLSCVSGLHSVRHKGPSHIDLQTLYKSKGKIPEVFLRGCGVPKEFIEFTTGLFDEQAIRLNNCFISYSHKDIEFARKLYQELFDAGVNTWIDFDKLKGGDFWADNINQAIHHYEKLVVCCSKNSLHSLGVDREINTVLRIEERIFQQTQEKVSIIIPVNMDDYVYQCDNHVARRLQERHIIDARQWESDFGSLLKDVIKALRTDEGRETPPQGKL